MDYFEIVENATLYDEVIRLSRQIGGAGSAWKKHPTAKAILELCGLQPSGVPAADVKRADKLTHALVHCAKIRAKGLSIGLRVVYDNREYFIEDFTSDYKVLIRPVVGGKSLPVHPTSVDRLEEPTAA